MCKVTNAWYKERMSVSQEELTNFLTNSSRFREILRDLGVHALRGKVGAAGWASGIMCGGPIPPEYARGNSPGIEGLIGRVVGYARFIRPSANTYAAIVLASRIAQPDSEQAALWAPTKPELQAHAALVRQHPDTIGGSAVCPTAKQMLLTLFRKRERRQHLDEAALGRLAADARPADILRTMSSIGLSAVGIELAMPSMAPVSELHRLERLFRVSPTLNL